MAMQIVADPTGTDEDPVTRSLRAARIEIQRAQALASPRTWEVLADLDYILEDQIVAIANAAEDDMAMATAWIDDDCWRR